MKPRHLLVTLLLSASAFAQTTQQVQQTFLHPSKIYRPMVRWWWPGGDIQDAELTREINLLDQSGFGGAEIQPFVTFDTRGFSAPQLARVNDFATPTFYAHVRHAADQARTHGMWIDDTFGSGWPFGGGSTITPELSALELRFADTQVTGPLKSAGKLQIPDWKPGLLASMMKSSGMEPDWPADWQARFDARSKIIAVVALKSLPSTPAEDHKPALLDPHSAVVLTEHMAPDGTLDWQVPAGNWHIFVFSQTPTRQPVIGAAGTGPQLVLDHLSQAAFAAHAKRIGDPLIAALGPDTGNSFRAIFLDSLELQQFIFWSDDFLAQFQQRRGYDLTPYLALVRQPGYNDFYFSHPGGLPMFDLPEGGDSIRRDYWLTVSELITERFYQPFDTWARQHKLLSRVQAHGAPADLLKLYGDASIPETEQLDGLNTINFMKLASSAGYDYGRRIVSSESFVFRGNPYLTTPESIKANSDKLFVSGVNQIVYHGFPYDFASGDIGPKGPTGLGWFSFQGQFSSQINEHNPIWPFIQPVNEYITRLQYITQQGKSDLQIALFRSSLNEEDSGPTPSAGLVKDPFPALEASLTSAGYSFGFVNDGVLLPAAVKQRRLLTAAGGSYQALLIPHETSVTPALVQTIRRFADAGLPIFFVAGLPGEDVSFHHLQQDRSSVQSGLRDLLQAYPGMESAGAADTIAHLVPVVAPQLTITAKEVIPFVKKTLGSTHFYLLTNPTDAAQAISARFLEASTPTLWNPFNGSVEAMPSTRNQATIQANLTLPPFGSSLVAFAASPLHRPLPSFYRELELHTVGEAGWSVIARGNSEQGIGQTIQVQMPQLTDLLNVPQLKTFSGRVTYTTHVNLSAKDLDAASRVQLDLGQVKDVAEVVVNGSKAGVLIVHPFMLDVRPLLHVGENEIQITAVNSLTNFASTIAWPKNPANPIPHYAPISAGLLGPVVLRFQAAAEAKPRRL